MLSAETSCTRRQRDQSMLAVAYHKEPHATQRRVARATVVRVAWRDGDEFVLGLGPVASKLVLARDESSLYASR